MPGQKHEKFMEEALRLAARGQGKVSPNPLVGAVAVKDGRVVGGGWHKYYGGWHAEASALLQAGEKARDGVLYVTLEPCNHHGKQPPCTNAIIASGIREVFAAIRDPNPVSKHGAEELQRHGIKVHFGLCEKEARKQNEFYIRSIVSGRPFIALKSAMTRDGFISYGNMKAKRICGKEEFAFAQDLRKKFDAVLVGVNTVIMDNPRLTYRKDPRFNPVRIVLDSKGRTPLNSRIFSQGDETIIVCTKSAGRERVKKFIEKGAGVIIAKGSGSEVDLHWLARALYKLGLRSVLVEAGNVTGTSFLESGLLDRIYIAIAPRSVKNGLKAFSPKKSIEVKLVEKKMLGKDLLLALEKNEKADDS